MKRGGPEFDELIGEDVPPAERARLRRVHDLLVSAGPPAEVPPSLAEPPPPGSARLVARPRARSRRVAFLAAAALATLSFGVGYLVGEDATQVSTFRPASVVKLSPVEPGSEAIALVQLGEHVGDGNWTMVVTAENLAELPRGDYYTLYMTKGGKRVVVCGTFNADAAKPVTVAFNVAYDRAAYDGWSVTRYWRDGHREREILRA